MGTHLTFSTSLLGLLPKILISGPSQQTFAGPAIVYRKWLDCFQQKRNMVRICSKQPSVTDLRWIERGRNREKNAIITLSWLRRELTGSSGNEEGEGLRPQRFEKQHSGQRLTDLEEEGKRRPPGDLVRVTMIRQSHGHHHGNLQRCKDLKHVMGRGCCSTCHPKGLHKPGTGGYREDLAK